jgi:hypothetical protein
VQFVDRIQRFLTLLEWQPGESGSAQAALQDSPSGATAPAAVAPATTVPAPPSGHRPPSPPVPGNATAPATTPGA